MGATPKNSLARVNTSASEPGKATRCLFGESLSTAAGSKASTARSSATRARTKAQTLSDRLTPSLISAGLVAGIIPTSMRERCDQLTLDAVLRKPAGETAAGPATASKTTDTASTGRPGRTRDRIASSKEITTRIVKAFTAIPQPHRLQRNPR